MFRTEEDNDKWTICDDGVCYREDLFHRPHSDTLVLNEDDWCHVYLDRKQVSITPYHDFEFRFTPRTGSLPVEEGYFVLKIEAGNIEEVVVAIPDILDPSKWEGYRPKVPEEIAAVFDSDPSDGS